jgi:DNA polymerase
LDPAALAHHLHQETPEPATRFWHHELTYPEVPADSAAAVRFVEERYTNCARCHLSNRRTRIAFVKGNPNAACGFLGEGPGRNEDIQGVPFVGRAGKLQDTICEEQSIDPIADIAWFNLVGCRPCKTRWSEDRPPTLVERIACSERTLGLLRAIRPRVLVCLGAEATAMFWDSPPNVWTWTTFQPAALQGDWLVVGYARHPAYLCRTIAAPGGAKELHAARRFYGELRERLPGLTKLPVWPMPLNYLSEAGRVVTGM